MKKTLVHHGKNIKSAGFFGYGSSNAALFDYLSENYGEISFTLRSDFPISANTDGFTRILFGDEARKNIDEDIIFLSPSVRRDTEEFLSAMARGVIFSSDVEFFFENKKIPVLAVTGSDGKSTTATLASLMLSRKGKFFPASANVGLPMTRLLESGEAVGTVAELSSFQLAYFAPMVQRALITNFTENHLDWHLSLDEYALAKENLLLNAEKRIFNLDCPFNAKLAGKYPAYALYSAKLSLKEMKERFFAEHYFSIENGFFSVSGEPYFKADRLLIKGAHNVSNFLAASALAYEIADTDDIRAIGESFTGLVHRARLVFTHGTISFFDSSIDSTPSRTKATLSAFSSPIVLILGGRGKNLSYAPLFPLPSNVKAVIITGENRGEIQKESLLYESSAKAFVIEDFEEAVKAAILNANEGDSVLLSPASTSFDRFTDYKERGTVFCEIIKKYYSAK